MPTDLPSPSDPLSSDKYHDMSTSASSVSADQPDSSATHATGCGLPAKQYLDAELPVEMIYEIARYLDTTDFLNLRLVSTKLGGCLCEPFAKLCSKETFVINLSHECLRAFLAISKVEKVALKINRLVIDPDQPDERHLRLWRSSFANRRNLKEGSEWDEMVASSAEEYERVLETQECMVESQDDKAMLASALTKLKNLTEVEISGWGQMTRGKLTIWQRANSQIFDNYCCYSRTCEKLRAVAVGHTTRTINVVLSAIAVSHVCLSSFRVFQSGIGSAELHALEFSKCIERDLRSSLKAMRNLRLSMGVDVDAKNKRPGFFAMMPELEILTLSSRNRTARWGLSLFPLQFKKLREIYLASFTLRYKDLSALIESNHKTLHKIRLSRIILKGRTWDSLLGQFNDLMEMNGMQLDELELFNCAGIECRWSWWLYESWDHIEIRFPQDCSNVHWVEEGNLYIKGNPELRQRLPRAIAGIERPR